MLQHLGVGGCARDAIDQRCRSPAHAAYYLGHELGVREVVIDRVAEYIDDDLGSAQHRLGQAAM